MATLLETILLSLPFATSPNMDAWHTAERNPGTVLVYTMAQGTAKGPILSIECRNRKTSVTIFWRQPMAGYYTQTVAYSIDGSKHQIGQWRLSTDQRTLGAWGPDALPFVLRLVGKNRLSVRAKTRRGASMQAQFNLTGLDRAVIPVSKACRWLRLGGERPLENARDARK